jgi:hypothetical protein
MSFRLERLRRFWIRSNLRFSRLWTSNTTRSPSPWVITASHLQYRQHLFNTVFGHPGYSLADAEIGAPAPLKTSFINIGATRHLLSPIGKSYLILSSAIRYYLNQVVSHGHRHSHTRFNMDSRPRLLTLDPPVTSPIGNIITVFGHSVFGILSPTQTSARPRLVY